MAKNRFILRYRGSGSIPAKDLKRIEDSKEVHIVDATSRMLLVEGESTDEVARLIDPTSQWIVVPEKSIPLPDFPSESEEENRR